MAGTNTTMSSGIPSFKLVPMVPGRLFKLFKRSWFVLLYVHLSGKNDEIQKMVVSVYLPQGLNPTTVLQI
eukprot:4745037-Amphidinium_carterae.2